MLQTKMCTDDAVSKALTGHKNPSRILRLSTKHTVGYHDIDYVKYQDEEKAYNCHMGQLKLFYTLLEFLTLCAAKVNLSDCLVVYIGAAPGSNIHVLQKFFPEPTYLLYDPAKFDSRVFLHKNVIVKSDKYGWFSMDTCEEIIKIQKTTKKKHILFVSDIRVAPTEQEVMQDMTLQKDAAMKLKAMAYMMKFRLPYIDDTDMHTTYRYLHGGVYVQLYPPMRSTETRLIGFSRPDGSFAMKTYNVRAYENTLNHHNLVVRPLYKYSKDKYAEHTKDASFEQVSEFHVWESYFRLQGSQTVPLEKIMQAIATIDKELGTLAQRRQSCKWETLEKHRLKKNVPMPSKSRVR